MKLKSLSNFSQVQASEDPASEGCHRRNRRRLCLRGVGHHRAQATGQILPRNLAKGTRTKTIEGQMNPGNLAFPCKRVQSIQREYKFI